MSLATDPKEKRKFASFAVLDLETSNLPDHRCNKVGITELSIYGIAASELNIIDENEEKNVAKSQPPQLPRVLHKLTLMVNPMMSIDPESTRATNLDNFMLEAEAKFNENAADLFLSFLKHLQQPVCLVAHNGYIFDFPILKYVLERINKSMPNDVYALDSLRAFHDIDELRKLKTKPETLDEINDVIEIQAVVESETDLPKNEQIFDARTQNETTPKRPIKRNVDALGKRLRNNDENEDDKAEEVCKTPEQPRSRRRLDFGETTPKSSTNMERRLKGKKWYPPKGLYKLPDLFRRTFLQDPIVAHHAEADVKTLTQLMLHYGLDFVDYSEEHALPFSEIPRLGQPNYI